MEMSLAEARWLAISAQGLGRSRPAGPVGRRHVRSLFDRIGVLQLDAINVVERTQYLVPFSRLGPYDKRLLDGLCGPGGELFEYWAHVASLVPMATQPLYRWRMQRYATGTSVPEARWREWSRAEAPYIAAVLDEVRQRGPLSAAMLSDPRRRDGEWWGRRSIGRLALEWLYTEGQLAAWRSPSFERVYDLTERVLPAAVLAAPTPSPEESHRQLLLLAANSLGVATGRDLADYYRIRPAEARLRLAELVGAGQLLPVTVEGWPEPAYCPPGVRPRRPSRDHATVLSPFDSLIWERRRTLLLFGFDYKIEVYTPAAQRRHGYFVMPVLLGDRLVGRLDLKADRKASALLVPAAHLEVGADAGEVAAAVRTELDVMASWLGLERVVVGRAGGLSAALRRARP
jgi:uncharacterized protein YcaQ